MKNGSSSTPTRPVINSFPHPFDPTDEMMRSPAVCHVSMEVSNIVTPQPLAKEKRTNKWSIDDFNIGRRLGEGSYSTVILVEEKKTGFLCALKVIKKSIIRQYHQEHQLIRELEIHMRLFHKHILRMYDFFYDTNRIYVILEYASNDTLASYLKEHHHLDNTRTATYVYQIADALHYCHRLQIMHRDLKPENILLGQFHEIKLADFGLALHCPSSRRTQYIGTMDYMAPEVIENEEVNGNDFSSSSIDSNMTRTPIPYEESADLWSLGIITFELLVGTTPFYDPDVMMTKKRILSCDYILPDHLHNDARHFIEHLIKYHRHDRFKLTDVFEHHFLQTFAQKNFINETLNQLASFHHFKNNVSK